MNQKFGDGLPVATRHLDDDLKWLIAQVVGQVGANAEGELATPIELLKQLDGARHGQAVTENQRFGARVHPVVAVMLNHALTPVEGVATVMAGAVKQLAKEHVEVTQKGVQTINVAQRNAQVTPVLFGPGFEGKHLTVTQTRAQRLASLQVFMRHGAQRGQA